MTTTGDKDSTEDTKTDTVYDDDKTPFLSPSHSLTCKANSGTVHECNGENSLVYAMYSVYAYDGYLHRLAVRWRANVHAVERS